MNSTPMVDPYSVGSLSKEIPTEEARLGTLEAALDPLTFALLERFRPQPGWRCLELGGGAGSVARWLAARCPDGHVTATDVDVRFLAKATEPNLTVLRHDVTVEEFPPGSFDLVHTRLMLHHLPAREDVLRRAAAWLAPGGWLVAEECDVTCTETSPYDAVRRVYAGLKSFMAATVGSDYHWARRMPRVFAGLGLADAGLQLSALHSGDPAQVAFWRATMEQIGPRMVEAGHLDPADLAAFLATVDSPDYLDHLWTMVAAWARRPT